MVSRTDRPPDVFSPRKKLRGTSPRTGWPAHTFVVGLWSLFGYDCRFASQRAMAWLVATRRPSTGTSTRRSGLIPSSSLHASMGELQEAVGGRQVAGEGVHHTRSIGGDWPPGGRGGTASTQNPVGHARVEVFGGGFLIQGGSAAVPDHKAETLPLRSLAKTREGSRSHWTAPVRPWRTAGRAARILPHHRRQPRSR